jgi:hypothetical protein
MREWVRIVSFLLATGLGSFASAQGSSAVLEQARAAQMAGDYSKAKATLFQAVKQFPQDVAVARAQARLLDGSGDPGRRDAYKRLLDLLKQNGQTDAAAVRRLAVLNLEAGDLTAAKAAGVWKSTDYQPFQPAVNGAATMHIPGPIGSFRRLAAISSQTPQKDVMAALSRNLFSLGFHYSQRLSKSAPTEYLTLVQRYVAVARELEKMGGSEGVLKVESCEAAGPLLAALGFRLRKGGCGPSAVLETEDSGQAFLTIDSGFPLAELENSFRTGKPFSYDVHGTDVPVMFGVATWFDAKSDPLDQLMEVREISRLYYAMTKMDSRTADALRNSIGIPKLLDLGAVLDFYGDSLSIENSRPVMPGGPEHLDQWAKLVGAEPAKPAEFLFALIDKDNGWLAAYADSLQHLDAQQQAYYFSNGRLERFYAALRGSSTGANNGAARPVFRPNAELLLLPQRMRFSADGRPLIPGGSPTWKALFTQAVPKNAPKGSAPTVNDADDVIAALYGKIRQYEENGLLNVFVALNEVDRRREHPMESGTVTALAHEYGRFSHHYSVFADWPQISDATINKFLRACDNIVKMKQPLPKADALGLLQASSGLWEILARQGEIPEKDLGSSYDALITPFTGSLDKPPSAVFDAGHAAVETLLSAAGAANVHPVTTARSSGAGGIQDTLLKLLAGPAPAAGDADAKRAYDYISAQLRAALDSQRLVRLDSIMGLADMLKDGAHPASPDAVLRLAGQLREFKVPMVYVSAAERNAAFPGYWTEKHLDEERDVNVGAMVEKKKRELLAPFLRDTLVGMNYAYYAPPGAQILFHNPLFVRSHDFMGRNGTGTGNEIWGPGKVSGTGWPLSGGGRLVGSLSGLPYGLAEAEQDFLIPKNTQALIWSDLAPQMVISAVVPRWWTATARQQRWVADHQRLGEDLVAESAVSSETRDRVMTLLRAYIEPHRREQFLDAVNQGHVDTALALLTPAELFRLSRRWTARGGPDAGPAIDSPVYTELTQMNLGAGVEVSDAAISRLFGVPRPKLSRSWRPELLGLGLLPAMQGYSSRLMAESWESNNLEWARLADELNLPPASLSWLAPTLTQKMLEHIFANHHEDWPAILRALRETTAEYRRTTTPSGMKAAE